MRGIHTVAYPLPLQKSMYVLTVTSPSTRSSLTVKAPAASFLAASLAALEAASAASAFKAKLAFKEFRLEVGSEEILLLGSDEILFLIAAESSFEIDPASTPLVLVLNVPLVCLSGPSELFSGKLLSSIAADKYIQHLIKA
jgi:hypothetical protein